MLFASRPPSRPPAPSRISWAPASTRANGPVASSPRYHRSRRVPANPVSAGAGTVHAGNPFARKRIHHTTELFGSCMMIVAFLALAIFA